MTAEEVHQRIQRIRLRLERLRQFLDHEGFIFQYPNDVLPGPDLRQNDVLAKIERMAGEVPGVLKEFYRLIGSVNLNGHHPEWTGCDYPDALVVFPVAYSEPELDDFIAQREQYLDAYGSFRIVMSPDYYHKEGVSGGSCYAVPVPSAEVDPPLLEEPHDTTFLDYLEIALAWGGFPGLEHASDGHTWPIEALQIAAGERS